MGRIFIANSTVEQEDAVCEGVTTFKWSRGKIRIAGLVLLGTTLPSVAGFAVSVPLLKWLCLAWLTSVAILMHCLSRRTVASTTILSVDERGILDHRLMPRHIEWHEIKAICRVDPNRSHVVDLHLRWPRTTLKEALWLTRIGVYCQQSFGVPAVTISMLMLEGNVAELINAVNRHRPDLLHQANRRVYLPSSLRKEPHSDYRRRSHGANRTSRQPRQD